MRENAHGEGAEQGLCLLGGGVSTEPPGRTYGDEIRKPATGFTSEKSVDLLRKNRRLRAAQPVLTEALDRGADLGRGLGRVRVVLVLRSWPEEPAQAVLLDPRDHVG